MKKVKTISSVLAILMMLFLASSVPSWAEYPDRPVKILVGFRAGGSVDAMARLLSQKAGDSLGQPVVVVNKPGGGGAIAAKETLRAKPDGYTLCFSVALTYAAWPYMTKVKYMEDDFTYIAAVGKFQEAFVSLPNKAWTDWKGLVTHAKKQGPLNVAVMTPYDKQVLRYIAKKEGIKFNMVPTKGGAAIMTQVLGNHVDFGFSGGIHYQYVKAGKMIVLAGHGQERLVATPDIPTLKELGYNIALENYNVVAGPKGIPADVTQKLGKAFSQAVQSTEYKDLLQNKLHFPAIFLGPQELPPKMKAMGRDFKAMAEFLK
ncbi:MAG: tripartite tricarboxylate transporter substrate binding protein [Desulfobacterales bacterium]|jgi:tripartite-type tricarboxylate transporter receptor subunit TctC